MTSTPEGLDQALQDLDLVRKIAQRVGTPFYLYSAAEIRRRIGEIKKLAGAPGLQARYGMKACSAPRILQEMKAHGIWIDAVSGNEVLRALKAGFAAGSEPPVILFTADVFRDNALPAIIEHRIFPNIGTPQMITDLAQAGYRGPIGVRINPGFGHGHVKECDTGGPSSKHGIWFEEMDEIRRLARRHGFPITLLHAHIGTGPEIAEFQTNIRRLVEFFLELIPDYPEAAAVNLGGGIPHPYRPGAPRLDLEECARVLHRSQASLSERAGRPIRLEIEPGRYFAASGAALITRVCGLKSTRTNAKGPGQTFVLVDAGFCDLVRPAMYGSYHHMEVLGKGGGPEEPLVVAGPLCESGDVFTRDAADLILPRPLPRPAAGDLIAIRDAGAYGEAMHSNYNSIGRAPQVWLDGGRTRLISRRETLDDLARSECDEEI
ncbi:MAG: diaminopimelate decarboxylase [Planctomycetes bacterium]|nr:diaminopimelate decarboxylase [Planctomycetota bacterium]